MELKKQFYDLKAKHPDVLLLLRCGDFYETYEQDAVDVSRILGITLTRRSGQGTALERSMAGFPYHALDTYLPKIIRAGRRVAICDQLELPKKKENGGRGFFDEMGTKRHTMSRYDLEHLYKKLGNFIADCTKEELEEHKQALLDIKGFIHKRIQEA